jgi:serine protease Do/serine protease DegQ
LIDLHGRLVGINTAIFSQGGGNIGIGFAIPINLAMRVTEQLLDTGTVQRGFFGISVQDLTPALVAAFGLEKNRGAVITNVVDNSPAADAGLQAGDILVRIDDKEIRNEADVHNQVGLLPVGEHVGLQILRGGERVALRIKVASRTQESDLSAQGNKRLAGVSIGEIPADNRFDKRLQGIYVVGVARGSLAWRSGLRQGDIITSVNHHNIEDVQTFVRQVDGRDEPLLLRILRADSALFIVI